MYSNLYKVILIFLLILGQVQAKSLAAEANSTETAKEQAQVTPLIIAEVNSTEISKDTNIIEVKDIKGGVQKIKTIDKPLPDTLSVQEENNVIKGKVEKGAEFHVLNEIQLNINDVSGPGKASSSMSDGVKYLENLNLYGAGNLGELNYQFNLGGRATNDDRIDVRSMTFTNLQGKASFRDHYLTAGDVFESYSQYSLNTSLKGGSYKFYNTEDNLPDVSLIYGYTYPRWESFFRMPDTRTMQRMGYGANIRHDFTPN